MGQLKEWVKQDWVRIGSDGSIKGKCGTSKDKSNPDRCLPRAKANSLCEAKEFGVIFICYTRSKLDTTTSLFNKGNKFSLFFRK